MGRTAALTVESESFSAECVGDVAVVRFCGGQIHRSAEFAHTEALTSYIERVTAEKSIKVVTFISPPCSTPPSDYTDLVGSALAPDGVLSSVRRMQSTFSTFVETLLGSPKIVVVAASGDIASTVLGVILAADHRVFGSDAHFSNPNLALDLTPGGGAAYFLARHVGRSRAYRLLLAKEGFSVQEALELGLVDEVVPPEELESKALEVARRFAEAPATVLADLKSLMNYSLREVSKYLAHESTLLNRMMVTHGRSDR